ncbi:22263_t:CDS:1, partial [Cetraspora pellucida]
KIKHNGGVDEQSALYEFFEVDLYKVEEQYYALFQKLIHH